VLNIQGDRLKIHGPEIFFNNSFAYFFLLFFINFFWYDLYMKDPELTVGCSGSPKSCLVTSVLGIELRKK
jgi:hypothetical protein